jgi:hypothetical protein
MVRLEGSGHAAGMPRRFERLLAVWCVAVALASGAAATRSTGAEHRTVVDAGGEPAAFTPITVASPDTTDPAATTSAPAAPATKQPATAPPKPTATTAAKRAAKPGTPTNGEVRMPPGPFTPRVLPAGYVPAVGDGWINRSPDQPQVSDPITHVPGQPFIFQGRVTDEAGNLLSGICVEVEHSGFGPKVVTGADGIFRFVADPEAEPRPALGVWVDLWDCTPRSGPGWYSLRTPISNLLTPGDTSTWFFRLMQASRLEGVIVDDATGLPVAGMCAQAATGGVPGWDNKAIRSAPTGPDGRFTLSLIAPWDTDVKPVPCGATGWSGIDTRFPFRHGTTVTGTLRAVAPWIPPPGYSGPDLTTFTLPPGGPASVRMPTP